MAEWTKTILALFVILNGKIRFLVQKVSKKYVVQFLMNAFLYKLIFRTLFITFLSKGFCSLGGWEVRYRRSFSKFPKFCPSVTKTRRRKVSNICIILTLRLQI